MNFMFEHLAKILIFCGIILVLIGLSLVLLPKIPYIGRLPGDIFIKKDKFVFYFPLATSILISLILTLILNLFLRKK